MKIEKYILGKVMTFIHSRYFETLTVNISHTQTQPPPPYHVSYDNWLNYACPADIINCMCVCSQHGNSL